MAPEVRGRPASGSRAVTPLGIAMDSDSLATRFVPSLADVARTHDAQLELQREDQDETSRLLPAGAALAAVASAPSASPGYRSLPLGSLVCVAVASPAWHARGAGEANKIGPGTLARAPRIDYDPHDDLQAAWLRRQGEIGRAHV